MARRMRGCGKGLEVASIEYVAKRGQRNRRDSVIERVCLVDRPDYISRVRTDRIKCKVGPLTDRWCGRGLALKRNCPLSFFDDKIHFGSSGCTVERNVRILQAFIIIIHKDLNPLLI